MVPASRSSFGLAAEFTSEKVFSGFENLKANAALWIPLTATAVQRVADTAVLAVWLQTPMLRQLSVFSLSLRVFLGLSVLRTAEAERLFAVTLFNCQACRKDAGSFSAVVPVEILPH